MSLKCELSRNVKSIREYQTSLSKACSPFNLVIINKLAIGVHDL